MRRFTFRFAMLLLLFAATPLRVHAVESMDQVLSLMDRYRDGGEERGLRVLSQDDGIAFYEGSRQVISQGEMQSLLQQPIKPGARGPIITDVQDALAKAGFSTGQEEKDLFGPETVKALKMFKEKNGLPAGDQLDAVTWAKLLPSMPFVASTNREHVFLGKKKGLRITHYITPTLIVDEFKRSDGAEAEKPVRWSYRLVGVVPRSEWPNLMANAASHGLMGITVYEENDLNLILMEFRRTGVSSISFGSSRALKFDPEFYRYMKISRKYGFRTSESGKMVILVHEPHYSLGGHYQMLPGLKRLFDDNPSLKPRFLVEGDLPEGTIQRNTYAFLNSISTQSVTAREYSNSRLAQYLSRDPVLRKRQVLATLANYVIDSPTAYQLYYGADIPSLAIDDPAALAQSPREIQPADTLESVKKLSELRQKMVQKGVDEKDDIIKILDYMGWLETAHAEAESQELVDLIVSRDELYGGMAKALAPIRNQGLSGYVDFLDKQHTAYESERKTYEQALVRDKTMAGFINYHFRSELKDRLPIAFIGSFHTPGIIAKLDSDVGYVVLEPQRVADATREEIERFYDAILDTKKLIQNLKAKRKGPVTRAPEVFSESVAILTPQVTNVGAPPELSKFLGAEPAAQIMNSIRSNSSIGDARVILADAGGAGKGPPDVPRLPGIFGSFHPGGGGPGGRGGSSGRGDGGSPPGSRPSGASGGGDGPMFVLYPKEKGKWEDLGERERWSRDRLSFLEKMILIPPFGRNEKIPKKMYVEQIGDKVYWIYYEPKTDAYYVLEGNEKINAMRILNLENNKNYIFHQNISVNEMQRKDKRS